MKDSLLDAPMGQWVPLGRGKVAYGPIVDRLRAIGYDGYLPVECLYPDAKEHDPRASVAHDLAALRGLLGA